MPFSKVLCKYSFESKGLSVDELINPFSHPARDCCFQGSACLSIVEAQTFLHIDSFLSTCVVGVASVTHRRRHLREQIDFLVRLKKTTRN